MSGKDYYKTLGVDKKASEADIKKAYKKLALKWHPDRVPPEKKDEAQSKFQEIGEAFDVLSDPEKKKMYDLGGGTEVPFSSGGGGGAGGFGFGGMPGGGGGTRTFHFSSSNADDIFKNFFGTSDPFAAEGGGGGEGHHFMSFTSGGGGMGGGGGMPAGMASMFGPAMMAQQMGGMGGGMGSSGGNNNGVASKKASPIIHDLNVTLEDLYSGTTKRMRITTKRIIDQRSGQTQSVAQEKQIVVKAGWKDGTKITYEGEGDEMPGVVPADIVFILKTKPHAKFKREGDNLCYECPVTLHEALTGVNKTLRTLDGRTIRIEAPYVAPDTIKTIANEGMPNSKTLQKGYLKITFKIQFPPMTKEQRTAIANIIR